MCFKTFLEEEAMADGRVFPAPSQLDIPSTKNLHRTKSTSDLSVVTDDSSILEFNPPTRDNQASISSKSSSPLFVKAKAKLSIKINGKDIESLSVQPLKTELGKRNMPISGRNKQVLLDRLKDAIQNVHQTAMATECIDLVNDDSMKPDSTELNKPASCQCYSLYLELKRDIDAMKTNQPLDKLKEENSALRAELLSLKKQCDIVREQQDSLKLALQIASKE